MRRSLFVLAALLLTCATSAAPAPKPFEGGWSKPVDPDGDCKIKRDNGTLIIEMPGSEHEYDPARDRVNAPRILRDFEGDFDIQLRLQIDCQPSIKSTVNDQPSYVAGGFVVFFPETFGTIFFRFQYGVTGRGIRSDGYSTQLSRDVKGGSVNGACDKRWEKWPFKGKPDHVYLRLLRERDGVVDVLACDISPDRKEWVGIGGSGFLRLPSKLKVALAAFSTSSEPSKVRFDQLKVTRGKKRSK